jgi:multidrug resistance efflux pump
MNMGILLPCSVELFFSPILLRGSVARAIAYALAVGTLLSACSNDSPSSYQGYVEGEFVHVAAPLAGRLEQLLVQRGQSVEERTLLFTLEADGFGVSISRSKKK